MDTAAPRDLGPQSCRTTVNCSIFSKTGRRMRESAGAFGRYAGAAVWDWNITLAKLVASMDNFRPLGTKMRSIGRPQVI
jgi:hypothetical protein